MYDNARESLRPFLREWVGVGVGGGGGRVMYKSKSSCFCLLLIFIFLALNVYVLVAVYSWCHRLMIPDTTGRFRLPAATGQLFLHYITG